MSTSPQRCSPTPPSGATTSSCVAPWSRATWEGGTGELDVRAEAAVVRVASYSEGQEFTTAACYPMSCGALAGEFRICGEGKGPLLHDS
ncbi:hypothetical protein E2C01_092964 [Portunus trituberculatus]|uniref:Uncharacterized protein n=1 Tax=Portunus trituberculatus TaxID=210409 RepID=A0A5B7JLP4_PORTR|nr:hypothetical protein [Portunus trituberculatus]